MPAPVKVNTRLDQIDAERFDAMLNSGSFGLFRARLVIELDRARADCEGLVDLLELRRAQGKAAALRTVLDLPATILKEITAKASK